MKAIIEDVKQAGGSAFMVGGCVRDAIMGIPCKDIDIEVFGISLDTLHDILERHGKASLVGESFGVIKFVDNNGEDFDFSIPRKENNVGLGHKDFDIELCPDITLEEAASRRDFTINTVMKDFDGNVIDNFGGVSDLLNGRLEVTSERFSEDPLRVLRGMQFCSRFMLQPTEHTIEVCKNMGGFDSISPSRLFSEFTKLLLKGKDIGLGLEFLRSTGWIKHFPALDNLVGLEQEKEWHPEGDVFTHTKLVCNAMVEICDREGVTGDDKLVLMLAALLHDVGKACTTEVVNGKITSKGHAEAGVDIAREFLDSILCPHDIRDRVLPLVQEHMWSVPKPTLKNVGKLSNRLGKATIPELLHVMEADMSGRTSLPKSKSENHNKVLELASELGVMDGTPKPLVMGRHLVEFMKPGPAMGKLLQELFKRQLDREFTTVEEGVKLAMMLSS